MHNIAASRPVTLQGGWLAVCGMTVWLSALPPQRRWSAPRWRPPSGRGVVQLLLYQLIAENAVQLPGRHGLEGVGVQQGSGLVFHIGPHIVPCGGQLRFFQIKAEKAESYYCLKPVREGRTPAAPGGCTPPRPCSRREKRASPPLPPPEAAAPGGGTTKCDARAADAAYKTPPFVVWAILCLSGCGCAIVPGRRVWYTIAIEIFCDTEKLYADHYTAGYSGHHAPARPRPHGGGGRMRRTQPPVRLRRGDPDCRPSGRSQPDEDGRRLPDPLPRRPHLRPAGAAADAGLSGPHPPAGAVRAEGARRSLGGTAGADGASAVSGLC